MRLLTAKIKWYTSIFFMINPPYLYYDILVMVWCENSVNCLGPNGKRIYGSYLDTRRGLHSRRRRKDVYNSGSSDCVWYSCIGCLWNYLLDYDIVLKKKATKYKSHQVVEKVPKTCGQACAFVIFKHLLCVVLLCFASGKWSGRIYVCAVAKFSLVCYDISSRHHGCCIYHRGNSYDRF